MKGLPYSRKSCVFAVMRKSIYDKKHLNAIYLVINEHNLYLNDTVQLFNEIVNASLILYFYFTYTTLLILQTFQELHFIYITFINRVNNL